MMLVHSDVPTASSWPIRTFRLGADEIEAVQNNEQILDSRHVNQPWKHPEIDLPYLENFFEPHDIGIV
jgi:hypothetical protein